MFVDDNNQTLATCTLADDLDEGEAIIGFPHEHINCYWMSGADDYWINFEIYDYNETLIFDGWGGGISGLFFDFTPDCSTDSPGACENFTATGAVDALESYLSWTNPSTTVGGEPVTLSSVVVLRDGEIINTIPDFDTFQQKFSNSLTFRIVLRHPKLFLKKGLDLLLPLG